MTGSAPTCPNCGYGFEGLRKSTRMHDCPSCGTTLFRETDALAPIGDHGDMHDVAMLLGLGDTVALGQRRYDIIGHARFDYGRGWWDEMWAVSGDDGAWISIDEGDVVIQRAIPDDLVPRWTEPPVLGATFTFDGDDYRVTEQDAATCIAIRGEFPELMQVGDKHQFCNATGPGGSLLSGEFWDGGRTWFVGDWLDPFEIKVERAT